MATPKDEQMAETQKRLDELDATQAKLMAGELPDNFHFEGVGHYHAAARDFFAERYGATSTQGCTLEAAEVLEDAANELHALCLHACGEVVRRGWWERLAIPESAIGLVQTSWLVGDPALYGRFDLAWDGSGTPKLLEYNAEMMLSNKAILPILWELNPGHPLLLPSSYSRDGLGAVARWVEKPFFGREGAGVGVHEHGPGRPPANHGSQSVYQQHVPLFQVGGQHVVWGLWMVGDACRGLSARGDKSPVTGNLSRFLPPWIEG